MKQTFDFIIMFLHLPFTTTITVFIFFILCIFFITISKFISSSSISTRIFLPLIITFTSTIFYVIKLLKLAYTNVNILISSYKML
jgi:hypothetical protein